jgi:hypothetical protein
VKNQTKSWRELPTFSDEPWQMPYGERAVLEGLLAQLRPRLAIEVGTAEGGSLRRIAAYAERVISFDLVEPSPEVLALANVELRTGDSHSLLGKELRRLETHGENVDFVLVDGDHTADGVRRDVEDLLASDALRHTVVVLHDTLNEVVRAGLEAIDYGVYPNVRFVELDFSPGRVAAQGELRGQCWNGLGVIVLAADDDEPAIIADPTFLPMSEVVWERARRVRQPMASSKPGADLTTNALSVRVRELAAGARAAARRLRHRA